MQKNKILQRTQFGNPILRMPTRKLLPKEIIAADTKQLITDMFYTLDNKKMGVGLAANQIGQSLAISVIGIKKTPARQDVTPVRMVIVNPEIIKTYGNATGMWEGCISFAKAFALTKRYKKIRLRYYDEYGQQQEADFEGLLAHVLQHETDHLNGILFVDKVKNTKSWMTETEYIKMRNKERKNESKSKK
jgi:peptide deformylase